MLNHIRVAFFLRFSATSAANVLLPQKAQKDAEFTSTSRRETWRRLMPTSMC